MSLTEYEDLINDLKDLLKEVNSKPEGHYDFVICLPGSLKGYFNIR